VLFIPALMLVGAGIDYGGVNMARSRLQAAVDSVALAVVAKGSVNDARQVALGYIQNQFPTQKPVVTTLVTKGLVVVTASVDVPMTILKMMMDKTTVSANATAAMGAAADKPMEVVIAMDSSDSMAAGEKMAAARDAAKGLLDGLTDQGGNKAVRVGFVPFTNSINIGMGNQYASWAYNTRDRFEPGPYVCTTTYPDQKWGTPYLVPKTCSSDGVSFDCSYSTARVVSRGEPKRVCQESTVNYLWYGCVGSQNSPGDENAAISPDNRVPGLLNNADCPRPFMRIGSLPRVIDEIDRVAPRGETYIAPGMLWAWRLLAPDGPFKDGAPYGSATKIIVLMTDGASTRSAKYPENEGSDIAAADAKLTKVCTGIKASGIRIFAVAFKVADQSVKSLLSSCASSPPYFYDARTNDSLKKAFAEIKDQVVGLRLVK
jgi:Flp pilus assembly protein TadG